MVNFDWFIQINLDMSAQKTFKASVQATKIDDMDAQEAMSASRTEGESDITEAVSEINLNKNLINFKNLKT